MNSKEKVESKNKQTDILKRIECIFQWQHKNQKPNQLRKSDKPKLFQFDNFRFGDKLNTIAERCLNIFIENGIEWMDEWLGIFVFYRFTRMIKKNNTHMRKGYKVHAKRSKERDKKRKI